MGYELCLADPDLWLREVVNSEGIHYYGYMLLYMDDCFCIFENERKAVDKPDQYSPMKPDKLVHQSCSGSSHPLATFFAIAFSKKAKNFSADLWFPLCRNPTKSCTLASSVILSNGN